MTPKTKEYTKGYSDCLELIDKQTSRSAEKWLNENVDVHNCVTAWNEVITCIEWLKTQLDNMKDNIKNTEVIQFTLIKKEDE